jgi:hypothetical protein
MIRLAKRIRQLLECYCQYDYAQNQAGVGCDPCAPEAERWCFWGAFRRACWELSTPIGTSMALVALLGRVNPYPYSFSTVNDRNGPKSIQSLVDLALVELERPRVQASEVVCLY